MNSNGGPTRHVSFGPFEVDFETGELHKHGLRLNLQEKPLRILQALLEKPGKLVTRDELRERLWAKDLYVDFDRNLTIAMNRLRTVLSDSAERPRYIETLPRRGYRFIAPLEKDGRLRNQHASDLGADLMRLKHDTTSSHAAIRSAPDAQSRSSPARPGVSRFGSRTLRVGAALAIVALAGIVAFLLRPTLPPPRVVRTSQLTHGGAGDWGVLATDGSRIYFSRDGKLAAVSTEGGEQVVIPTDVRDPLVEDISPDGVDLLVSEGPAVGGERAIYIVRTVDGSARRPGNLEALCAGWLRDGRIAIAKAGGMYVANSDGSNLHWLVGVPGRGGIAWPRASPDGRFIRFEVWGTPNAPSLWQVHPDGTDLHPPLGGWNDAREGGWTPGGSYFLFTATDAFDIFSISEQSGFFQKVRREPVQLTTGPIHFASPIPSRDGKRIYAYGELPRGELVRFDSRSHRFLPYLGGISAFWPSFSSDGNEVVYASVPEGTLLRSKPEGTLKTQLTFPPIAAIAPRWSPKRREIAFMAKPGEQIEWNVYLVSADGGAPERLLPEKHDQTFPDWSPDGSRLVFGGDPDSGEAGLRVLDLRNHQTRAVAGPKGLSQPRWSPDGRYIVVQETRPAQGLMLLDVTTQSWSELVKLGANRPSWSHDGTCVYFLASTNGKDSVYRVRLSDRKVDFVLSLEGIKQISLDSNESLGLAPDNSILLTRDVGTREIYALDWEAP